MQKATMLSFPLGNSLKGEGLKAGSQVAVYTINGQLVGRSTVSQSGTVEIPLDGQTGVFVVNHYLRHLNSYVNEKDLLL